MGKFNVGDRATYILPKFRKLDTGVDFSSSGKITVAHYGKAQVLAWVPDWNNSGNPVVIVLSSTNISSFI